MPDGALEKTPRVEIVPATPEDATAIRELLYKSWMETFAGKEDGITEDDVNDLFETKFSLENITLSLAEAENIHNFVAKEKDTIVGYCRARENPETNLLARIFVESGRKGERIGSKLWKEARTVLNHHKDTVLGVALHNEEAQEVYRKWGFVDTAERFEEEPMKSGAHRTMMKMVLKAAQGIESVPEHFDVIVDLDEGEDILTEIAKKPGIECAVCVDLRSGKLYIGDGHKDILQRHPIPEVRLCRAAAKFNDSGDVEVSIIDYAFGAPKRPIEPDVLINRMVAALRRDVLKKQN